MIHFFIFLKQNLIIIYNTPPFCQNVYNQKHHINCILCDDFGCKHFDKMVDCFMWRSDEEKIIIVSWIILTIIYGSTTNNRTIETQRDRQDNILKTNKIIQNSNLPNLSYQGKSQFINDSETVVYQFMFLYRLLHVLNIGG